MRRGPARRDFRRDFASCAKAGVNEAHVAQPGERIRIEVHPRRLADDFTVPAEPEPLKILDYAAHKDRSEEHTSELQSLMRISYAVFCLKKKKITKKKK